MPGNGVIPAGTTDDTQLVQDRLVFIITLQRQLKSIYAELENKLEKVISN